MKSKHFFLIIFSLFLSQSLLAQNTWRGRVLDSLKKEALPFASLRFIPQDTLNNRVDLMAISDEEGKFLVENIQAGTYRLQISLFNQIKHEAKLLLSPEDRDTDLGDILVAVDETVLDQVNVFANQVISQEADRLIYHVERDPQHQFDHVLATLEKVPMISVLNQNQIQYLGTTAFKILIDGKSSSSLGSNLLKTLQNMPATSIHKIEVITHPSARYLSEGVMGIINIHTKKRLNDGLEGFIGGQYRIPNTTPGANLHLTGKSGKFGGDFSVGMLNSRSQETEYSRLRESFDQKAYLFNQQGGQKTRLNSVSLNTSLAYEPSPLHLLSARGSFYKTLDRKNSWQSTQIIPSAKDISQEDPLPVNEQNLDQKQINAYEGVEFGMDYQMNFKNRPDRVLNVSYLFMQWKENIENRWFPESIHHADDTENSWMFNKTHQQEQSVQWDFTQQILKTKWDLGAKGVFREGSSSFKAYSNRQNMGILYTSFQYRVNQLSVMGGLRYEYTYQEGVLDGEKNRQDYDNFVPNLSLNWNPSSSHSFNLNYTKTIRRPNVSYLSPFSDDFDPYSAQLGNPNLKPVLMDNFSFQFRRVQKGTLIVNLRYAYSNNTIQRLFIETDTTGVARFQMMNMGKKSDKSLLMSYTRTFYKKFNVNASGNLIHTALASKLNNTDVQNKGFTGSTQLGLNYMPQGGWRIGMQYTYQAPSIRLQGKSNQMAYYSFNGSKNFMKNKLTVSAILVNPFERYFIHKSDYIGEGFMEKYESQLISREFQISLSYRFGNLKEYIRSNRKSINNADAIGSK